MWVSVKSRSCYRKEKQDTLILDTCNIISFFYCLLRKERQEGNGGKRGAPFLQVSKIGVSGVGVLLRWVATEKEEKDTRNTLKNLDNPFLHAKLFTLYRMKRTKVREDKEALFFQGSKNKISGAGVYLIFRYKKGKGHPKHSKKTWTPLFTYYIRYSYLN